MPHAGQIHFFDVDPFTGNIWVVEGQTKQVVGITNWTNTSSDEKTNNLISKISQALSTGCYCVRDLDQSTRCFVSTSSRYTLFGGVNRVVFARTSIANTQTNINSSQTILTDFSSPENFLVTELPDPAGSILALEYSRQETGNGNQNYFFAGTQNGLFAFVPNNNEGFNVNSLKELNDTLFNVRSWKKINSITGSVIAIKSLGNALYVLTFESNSTLPIKNTIYKIAFTNNINTMFLASNVRTLATTGIGIFASISQFFSIELIATGQPNNPSKKEQLIVATNQGLFRTNANQTGTNGISDATDQITAAWELIDGTNKTMFFGIGAITSPNPFTVWPFSVQDENRLKTFERGSIHQISGTGDTSGNAAIFNSFLPTQFNTNSDLSDFDTFYPITNFWSDGGRRFFIFNRVTDVPTQNKLSILPFDIKSINSKNAQLINHPAIAIHDRFFWLQTIGATGFLMTGTNNGIVCLE